MKNFVNPKKIKGQDKLDRIKDLMGKMSTLNESTSTSEVDNVKRGANGVIYGIVRENHSYFIKTTEKTSGTILAEDFNYIGGLQNKNSERYDSYAEALKQLNLKFDMLNESFGVKTNVNLFESDAVEVKEANASGVVVKEEEPKEVEEQKKVIKVDAPTPSPAPVEDEGGDPFADEEGGGDPFADEEGGGDPFADEEGGDDPFADEEGGEDDGDDKTKKIQKLTGKIGQLLRDKDEPDAELDKYVINSIVSAIDWEEIPDEDVEDIIAKIEGEDEEDGELEGGDDPFADEEGGEDPFADEEGGEELSDEEGGEELAESEEIKEEKETINISKKQMEMLKKDGKCDCGDVTLKLDESDDDGETHPVKEAKRFSKKQLMDNFLKKNINESLNKILNEELICEKCGEMHEGECGTHIHDEYSQDDRLGGDDIKIDEENMSVVDAISTGQNYLQASGDLDRDGDQIPNRLDMDSNMDGDLDHPTFDDEEFIEIDFDSLMGNSPAPTKEPGIAPPTTDPGPKKPRWKKIGKPDSLPKPKAMDRRKFHLGRKGMYR